MKKTILEEQVNERIDLLHALMRKKSIYRDGTFHPMPWVIAFCFCIDDLAKRSFNGLKTNKKLKLKVKLDILRALTGTTKSIEESWDGKK